MRKKWADPKKLITLSHIKKMVHRGKKLVLEQIEANDYKTSADDPKRTIFNEGCGQRLQNDKLVQIHYSCNAVITKSKVRGSEDADFMDSLQAVRDIIQSHENANFGGEEKE